MDLKLKEIPITFTDAGSWIFKMHVGIIKEAAWGVYSIEIQVRAVDLQKPPFKIYTLKPPKLLSKSIHI